MELRKDPITKSWVVVGARENPPVPADPCPLCSTKDDSSKTIWQYPAQGPWQVRVLPHLDPLYHIEGEVSRAPEGLYDRMQPLGAHEIVVETPDHGRSLAHLPDEEILQVLNAYAARILDLKRDMRFKYITVFKNRGPLSGEDWSHSHSQITATTFVPRRVLYELRSAREYFQQKERCVFCDIVRQEERQGVRVVDSQDNYVAFCPYASRVPFEMWLIGRQHNHVFETPRPGVNRASLAALLGRTLRRLSKIAQAYHLVLHTAPNTQQTKGELSEYWKTIADDFHWHIEILPIVEVRSKSYSIKEVYFNAQFPEECAERLRALDPAP